MFQEDGAIRVIEGPEVGDTTGVMGEFEAEPDVLKSKFKKFIREFMYTAPGAGSTHIGTLKYRDQLQQNCEAGFFKLQLDINDLIASEESEVLAHRLRQQPTEFLPICEKALQELYMELVKQDDDNLPAIAPPIQLSLTWDVDLDGTFGTMKPMMIRELTSDQVEKLVVIQGIIIQARVARHKARNLVLRCSNCENLKEIRIGSGWVGAHIPSSCDGNMQRGPMEKCPPNSFQVVADKCEFRDEQRVKLQELPEHVPVGEMPRSIDLCLDQYHVDNCIPGTRLSAIGIYCATENSSGQKMGGARQKGTNTVKFSYVQVLGMEAAHGKGGSAWSHDDEERFEAMAKEPDIREKIYRSVAPAICASKKDVIEDVKKAVACLLFGGARKLLADNTRMRGDINVLLLGDPGTAKSQFLKFTEKAAPIAVYTSGKGSSAAGLTAAIRKDATGFVLEGGAMVLADQGVVCIDEFDKMNTNDRVAIHEAMEQQTISIAKAGITTMLNTRCSVLAAANPRFGSYDDLAGTADQIDFETTILSRFDMMFLVRDVRDKDRDYFLAKHLTTLHKGERTEENEGPIPVAELSKYIRYCRDRCSPRLTPNAAEVLKNHYITIRAAMKREKESGRDGGIPITVRQLEAIVRISESLAKMEMCEDVDTGHVEEALRLFTVSTLDSANNDRGIGIDSLSEEQKNDMHKAEEQVRRKVQRGGRIGKFELERFLVSHCGVEERTARRTIHILTMRGDFEEKANNTLQRVNN